MVYCICHYLLRIRHFLVGHGGDEYTGHTLTTIVGDLACHYAVRQCKTSLAERTHRRDRAVALAVTRYGIGVVRTEFHRVVLVGEGSQRLVHRHLRHEGDSHAISARCTRDGKVGEIVLILRHRPLQAHAVVRVALGSGERGDDRLARRCHTDRSTGQRADGTHRRAYLHRIFDRLAGRDAFRQHDRSEVAVRVVLAVGRAVHYVLHAVEHIRSPYTLIVAHEGPTHMDLTACILCGDRR